MKSITSLILLVCLSLSGATVPLAWDSSGPYVSTYTVYGIQGAITNRLATFPGSQTTNNVTVPDATWTFAVTATIGATESPFSNLLPVIATDPIAPVINQPSPPNLTSTGYSLTVTWAAIPSGFHATNYLATLSKPDGTSESKTNSSTIVTFSGLSNGPYSVSVSALSFWGQGDLGIRPITILGPVQKLRVP